MFEIWRALRAFWLSLGLGARYARFGLSLGRATRALAVFGARYARVLAVWARYARVLAVFGRATRAFWLFGRYAPVWRAGSLKSVIITLGG